MPFGPDCEYPDFDACVSDNQDKEDPEAYCAALQEATEDECASQSRKAKGMRSHEARLQSYKETQAKRLLEYAIDNGLSAADLSTVQLPWYSVTKSQADEDQPEKTSATVLIYDEIGGSFGVDAEQFAREINAIEADVLKVRINSPGGSVYDGIAIYNSLNHHPARVVVYADSLVASIASVIAMAGDDIIMMPGSQMMIHDAWGTCQGNPADMQRFTTFLDRQSQNSAEIYASRAGGEVDTWRGLMREETWLFAHEAVQFGLADRVDEREVVAANDDAETRSKMRRSFRTGHFQYDSRSRAPLPSELLTRHQRVSTAKRRWKRG